MSAVVGDAIKIHFLFTHIRKHLRNTTPFITAIIMISFLMILLSIISSADIGNDEKRMNVWENVGKDITSTVMTNIDTQQLVRLVYDPLTLQSHTAISQELRERIRDGRTNNRELLLSMHRLGKKGKMPHFEEKISENVRIRMQRRVDEECSSTYCILTPESSEMTNCLLKALAYFGKEIVVPSQVSHLHLSKLELTSLWVRFEQHSKIQALILPNMDFEELNNETFGQYIHKDVRKKLKTLSFARSKSIAKIDFDELTLSNLKLVNFNMCTALSDMKNIPQTMERIWIKQTGIRHKEQLTFEKETGNKLWAINCDEECEDEFDQVFKRLGIMPN